VRSGDYPDVLPFFPGQRVNIKALDDGRIVESAYGNGLVVRISIGLDAVEYLVRYWHNGDRKEAWFLADEMG
jgi:hypothetical protein